MIVKKDYPKNKGFSMVINTANMTTTNRLEMIRRLELKGYKELCPSISSWHYKKYGKNRAKIVELNFNNLCFYFQTEKI